jgi:ectoine hydroxylase-related dioxygenase (phytanoyl-CoA dioxygenase family)
MPLWGSNENSSLPLVPGSHYWRESDIERTKAGSKVDGIQFTVPAVTATRYGLSAIRPNPAQDEVLVFSPYLTHCGGKNLSSEQTRLSLEMRFWER